MAGTALYRGLRLTETANPEKTSRRAETGGDGTPVDEEETPHSRDKSAGDLPHRSDKARPKIDSKDD